MSVAVGTLRAELCERFSRSVATACAGRSLPEHAALRLPPLVRDTLVGAALLRDGAIPPPIAAFYTERLPRLRVEQLLAPHPALRPLLQRPLDLSASPRLAAALAGLFAALRGAGLDPQRLLGSASPEALLRERPTIAALYGPTLHGAGFPLLGTQAADCAVLAEELAAGRAPDEVIDLRLSGNLVHELCHGPCVETSASASATTPPWLLIEAAALHLGRAARPAHVFPDEPAEAIPGVSLFVLAGDGLARIFGEAALWRVLLADDLTQVLPPRVAAALSLAGWQEHLRQPGPSFASDALRALDWIKLADASRAPLSAARLPAPELAQRDAPDLLDAAAALPWSALPLWQGPATAADALLVQRGVRALFQVNRLCPTFQTHPDELPDGSLQVDVAECLLRCAPRADGVFAEPARWLFPPALCRRLHERGAAVIRVAGARRRDSQAIADALVALAQGGAPLPREVVIQWTCSRP